METTIGTNSCRCNTVQQQTNKMPELSKSKKTAKVLPSMMLSILIAFFPKCPVCWAMYMSMFGSIGLAQLPYMGWLLPVLMTFLGIHLYMLFKKAPQNGYVPFMVSLTGAIVIICGRTFFPNEKWLLISGMVMIISGSLLNSFSDIRLQFFTHKTTNI